MDKHEFWGKTSFEDQKWLIAGDCPWEISVRDAPAHCAAIETEEIRKFMQNKKRKNKATILEIGCGVGRLLKHWTEYNVVGVDLSPAMIEKAKEYLKDVEQKVELHAVDGKLPLEAESVDFVYSFCVFQHIQTKAEVDAYINEAMRVLKPGGYLRIQTLKGEPRVEAGFGGFHGRYYPSTEALVKDVERPGLKITEKNPGLLHHEWLWVTARKS